MTFLSFGVTKSASLRKRKGRRSLCRTGQKPAFDRLEDRCLLAVTYTTPPAFEPVVEMVYGPAGDIWFARQMDTNITHITSDGTLTEFGVLASGAQPVNLEVDANDNLWFTSSANAPANHLFKLTPAGNITEISDFTTYFDHVSQDPVPPVSYLTFGHVNADNSGVLVGIKADGSTSFYPLPTSLPVGQGLYARRPLSVVLPPPESLGGVFYPGSFWYTDNNAIAEYGPEGELDRWPLPDANDEAESITVGANGNLWFVEDSLHVSPQPYAYYLADKIGKISVDGTMTMFDVKRAGFRYKIGPLVPGTDGSVWFDQVGVEEDGFTPEPNTHRIGRINPDGSFSYYIPPDSSAGASAPTVNVVGPSGAVADSPWFDITPFAPQSSIVEAHTFSELTPVNAVNHAPVAVNDSVTVNSGDTV